MLLIIGHRPREVYTEICVKKPTPHVLITDWLTFLIVLRLIKNNFLEIIWLTGWLFDWLVDFWAKQMGYVLGGSARTVAQVHNDNVADQ